MIDQTRSSESSEPSAPRYMAVARRVEQLIADGVFVVGDRLPSLRQLARDWHVSLNTVATAYTVLESAGRVEARRNSGHYVRAAMLTGDAEQPAANGHFRLAATAVHIGRKAREIQRELAAPITFPLGGGGPNPDLLPAERLHRLLARQLRRSPREGLCYAPTIGFERLRVAIARRMASARCAVAPQDIIVTSGCTEALTLALQATCRPGDCVAVGAPVYFAFLNLIQSLGLRVLEVPTSPGAGIDLGFLAEALERGMVNACLVLANFNNPLGCVLPETNKQHLVALLGSHGIPLIEDDVYGDLGFAASRPTSCLTYDRQGLVLSCSSISKTLAPGYRVGWIAPGRYRARVESLKALSNVATPSPTQLAVAEFLANGGYDHHLRSLRRAYQRQTASMRGAVLRSFPAGTVVSQPAGGSVIWVSLAGGADATSLHEQALRAGIAIAPDRLFSLGRRFGHCFRLNAAYWSPAVEEAIGRLGTMAHALPVAAGERALE